MRHAGAGIVRGEAGGKETGELVMGYGERCRGGEMPCIQVLLL